MQISPASRVSLVVAINIAALAGVWLLGNAATGGLLAQPATFWIPQIIGSGAWLMAGFVWALNPRDLAARLFLASGFSTLVFTFAATPAWPNYPESFLPILMVLAQLNAFGAASFGIVMIALFLIYPQRLPRARLLSWLSVVVFIGWSIAALSGLPVGGTNVQHITLVEMLLIFAAIGAQFVAARNSASLRAIAIWLGGAVAIGAGGFIFTVALPAVVGAPLLVAPEFAFASFLIIYAGVAIGLRRYRLFELNQWAFRFMFYASAAVLIFLFDAMLAILFSWQSGQILGVGLVLIVLLYLPLREKANERFFATRRVDPADAFNQVINVAFSPETDDRSAQWHESLRALFDPLNLEVAATSDETISVSDDRTVMTIPAIGSFAPVRIQFPWQGRGFFTQNHLKTAETLVLTLGQAEETRAAFRQGVLTERTRISQDMHDNIGAQLLSALHHVDLQRKDSMIRSAVSDLRGIINDTSRPDLSFDEAIAEARLETGERLEAAGIRLAWDSHTDNAPALPARAMQSVLSILREGISNVIRHADADHVSVSIKYADAQFSLMLEDNGRGVPAPDGMNAGNGLGNIAARATALRGSVQYPPRDKGFAIEVIFPDEGKL